MKKYLLSFFFVLLPSLAFSSGIYNPGSGGGGGSSGGTINPAPQFDVGYYSSSGSTTTISGANNFTTDGSSVTVSTVVITGPFSASSGTVSGPLIIGAANGTTVAPLTIFVQKNNNSSSTILMEGNDITNGDANIDYSPASANPLTYYERIKMTNQSLGSGVKQARYQAGWNFMDGSGNVIGYILKQQGGNLTLNTTGQITLCDGPSAHCVTLVSNNSNANSHTMVLPNAAATSTNSFVNIASINGIQETSQFYDLFDSTQSWTGMQITSSSSPFVLNGLSASSNLCTDSNKNLTTSGCSSGGTITSVTAGFGLAGGGSSGGVTLALSPGASNYVDYPATGTWVNGFGLIASTITSTNLASSGNICSSNGLLTTTACNNGTITGITPGYSIAGGVSGNNITVALSPNATNYWNYPSSGSFIDSFGIIASTITSTSLASSGNVCSSNGLLTTSGCNNGTLTGVTAGFGLAGGGTSGNPTIALSPGASNYWNYPSSGSLVDNFGFVGSTESLTSTATIGGLTLSNQSGTQCLHEVNGVVSGTGSDCGTGGGGGGSGTVNAAAQFSLPYYSLAGSSTVLSGYPYVTVSTQTGASAGIQISTYATLTTSGTTPSLKITPQGGDYGSNNDSVTGGFIVDCPQDDQLGECAHFFSHQGTTNSTVYGSGVVNVYTDNNNWDNPQLYIEAAGSSAQNGIKVNTNGYATLELIQNDLTVGNTKHNGQFQVSSHADSMRFERRQSDNSQFDSAFTIVDTTGTGIASFNTDYGLPASTVDIQGSLGIGGLIAENVAAPANGLLVQGQTIDQSTTTTNALTSLASTTLNGYTQFTNISSMTLVNAPLVLAPMAQPNLASQGAMYYDSTQNAFEGNISGATATFAGVIWTITADSNTNNNVAVSTMLASAKGVGSSNLVLPANFWTVGKTIYLVLSGTITTSAANTLVVSSITLGGVPVVASTGPVPAAPGVVASSSTWQMIVTITCRSTGSSGIIIGSGQLEIPGPGIDQSSVISMERTNRNINTTISEAINWQFQWLTANGANGLTLENGFIEVKN